MIAHKIFAWQIPPVHGYRYIIGAGQKVKEGCAKLEVGCKKLEGFESKFIKSKFQVAAIVGGRFFVTRKGKYFSCKEAWELLRKERERSFGLVHVGVEVDGQVLIVN